MFLILFLLTASIILFSFLKKKKNFFTIPPDCELNLEKDRTERKKVLKKLFDKKLIPNKIDTIVIGSGSGGLTCAALLAKAGKKVVVLEKHKLIGGCTHTFCKKGFEFDVGIHYVGNMEPGSLNRFLFDFMTNGKLKWTAIDEQFDTVVLDENDQIKKFDYYTGWKKSKESLKKSFPKDHEAIDKYFQLLHSLRRVGAHFAMLKILPLWFLKFAIFFKLHKIFLKNYEKYSTKSLKEVVDGLTNNEDLKAVLCYSFGDYGTFPSRTPFLMHALLNNHFLRSGGFYPVGGASEIAYQMIPVIEEAGGVALGGAAVSSIIFENGKAVGVIVNDNVKIYAENIVSDAGVYNTYNKLVDKEIVERYGVKKTLKGVQRAYSFIQVFVGLEGTKDDLNLPSKQFWVFNSPHIDRNTKDFMNLEAIEAANSSIPLLFVSFPSAKDHTYDLRHPGKSSCAIVTFCNHDWFSEWSNYPCHKRGQDYESMKSAIAEQAWKQVLRLFPHLKDKVAYFDSGSPLTHAHYINNDYGEIYGIDHNIERFQIEQAINLRPETLCPGLYLTGQDIFTCGFIGSSYGGLLTASKLLDTNLLNDMLEIMPQYRKTVKK